MKREIGAGGQAPALAKHLEKTKRSIGAGGQAPALEKHLSNK